MKKLLTRNEYETHVKGLLKGRCAFCSIEDQLLLAESKHWYWVVSLSPYWKYHTMLVSKRHESRLVQLTEDERDDYFSFYKKISDHLVALRLVHDDGEVFNQILIMVRERIGKADSYSEGHEKTDHLHIHILPDKEGFDRYVLDPSATNFDFERLKM